MADDFFGPPTDAAADVPAEIQIDGQVTETNTGEQVANEGGNPVWWDETYPGQTQNAPAPAVNESAAETARLAQQNQQATGTPVDVSSTTAGLPAVATNVGGTVTTSPATPTQDAYGLNILNAQQTAQLTKNINPKLINSLVDPNSPQAQAGTNAVNKSAAALPAYVDSNGVAFDPVTGVSYPVDRPGGKQLIPADVLAATDPAAQVRIEMFGAGAKSVATPVDTGAGAAIAAANKQTAADATRLNAQSPNPYLTQIDKAAAEISKGQDGIATANQTIQSAQQKIADSESYIAQNNAELADPNISAARRAELEANNAAQVQNVLDQTQSITENQAYIATTQETIQSNEVTIDTNSAGYRATTAGSNVPVVDVNADPNFRGPQQITATSVNPTTSATRVDPATLEGYGVNEVGATTAANTLSNAVATPAAVNPNNTGFTAAAGAGTAPFFGSNPDAEQEAAAAAQVGRQLAQQQAVLAAQKRVANNSDWRVRLQLAPGANYLYNAPQPGILWPLRQTDGVIFPYTPKIMMNYKADYETTALTHSNYKGYFYKGSSAEPISLNAMFTAQDTSEAEYLLAVIHFFRSATKMFYGQDPNRGAPPPLVYLTGLGEFQFTQHPCVIANFNYNLPSDVDYIRARSTNINGTNLLTRRDQQSLPTNPISGAVARLQNLFSSQGINKGALFYPPPTPNLGQNQPTYVPTKMEIDLTLYPMQSRQQISRVFDNRQYNNGAQLKGGFW